MAISVQFGRGSAATLVAIGCNFHEVAVKLHEVSNMFENLCDFEATNRAKMEIECDKSCVKSATKIN